MKEIRISAICYLLMIAFFAMLITCNLTSCTTQKKVLKWMNNHPDVSADFCGDEFPVKTEYRPGKTITKSDTVYKEGPTIPCPEPKQDPATGKTIPGSVKCPGSTIVHDTILKVDTLYRENTAKVTDLSNQLAVITPDRDKLQKDFTQAKWTIVVMGLVILGCLFLLTRK